MVEAKSEPVRRLPRAQRREQILAATTTAFARNGFAATGLDDIAAEAGITRVILYRHFDSKTDLYQAALDRICAVLSDHVAEPVGGFTDASIDGLLKAAIAEPDGFRLLFVHAAREPEFKALADRFRSDVTEIAHLQISQVVADQASAPAGVAPGADRGDRGDHRLARRRAARPGPGRRPGPARHRRAITAAAARTGLDCLPPTP